MSVSFYIYLAYFEGWFAQEVWKQKIQNSICRVLHSCKYTYIYWFCAPFQIWIENDSCISRYLIKTVSLTKGKLIIILLNNVWFNQFNQCCTMLYHISTVDDVSTSFKKVWSHLILCSCFMTLTSQRHLLWLWRCWSHW